MKITRIELTNFLAHRRLSLPLSPLTIACGPNGSGKSSIAEAIAFAIMGELRRVDMKGDRPLLISDGAKAGEVGIRAGDTIVIRDVATGKMKSSAALPLPDDAVKSAMPFLLDASRFAALPSQERRTALLDIMRVALTTEAILKEMVARGHPKEILSELDLKTSADAWRERAERSASEARGGWKATTGEVYGQVKAETWAAPVPAVPPGDEDDIAGRVSALAAKIEDLQRELGAFDADNRSAARVAGRRQELLRRVEKKADAKTQLAAAEAQIGPARLRADTARAAVPADDGGRPTRAAMDCPHCGGSVVHQDGKLVAYVPRTGGLSPDAVAARKATFAKAEAELGALERKAEVSRRVLREAEEAEAALREIDDVAPTATPVHRADIEAELKDAQNQHAELLRQAAAIRDWKAAVRRAEQATAQAAGLHARVKAWTAVRDALAPDGIPGELLAKALGPFDATLRGYAAATGWSQVTITPEIGITAGGRPYGLLSESEQWRADAMLAAAIAHHSGLRFMVLDRLDVLDVPSRKPALVWLYSLTKGDVDGVLILGTMKEPPKAPPDVAVHWLGGNPEMAAAA